MRQRFVLTVSDDQLDRIDDVVAQASQAGFDVEQVLPSIGIITGSADESQVPRLESLAGINAVEPDRDVTIPPPDSDIS